MKWTMERWERFKESREIKEGGVWWFMMPVDSDVRVVGKWLFGAV